jgi:hypothetical protein
MKHNLEVDITQSVHYSYNQLHTWVPFIIILCAFVGESDYNMEVPES